VVIEYIRYTVPSARSAEFVQAYTTASAALEQDPHCLGWEIAQGVEEPEHFVVRLEWDSVEGHEQNFRGGPHFGEFFAAVQPFFSEIQEMKHYAVQRSGLTQ
jgi:quinol monooxygenase YgiN